MANIEDFENIITELQQEEPLPLPLISHQEVIAADSHSSARKNSLKLDENGNIVYPIIDSGSKEMGWVKAYRDDTAKGWRVIGYKGAMGDESNHVAQDILTHAGGFYAQLMRSAPEKDIKNTHYSVVAAIIDASFEIRKLLEHEVLFEVIPGLTLDSAGGAFPYQAFGTIEEMCFYFRYRSGYASLKLAKNDEDVHFKPSYIAGMDYGDDLAGFLSVEEFHAIFLELVKNLKKSPILWDLIGISPEDTNMRKKGEPTTFGVWAETPEEAWDIIHDYSHHEDVPGWEEYVKSHHLTKETTTVDDRYFPENFLPVALRN